MIADQCSEHLKKGKDYKILLRSQINEEAPFQTIKTNITGVK
jgi:hypothetical protein